MKKNKREKIAILAPVGNAIPPQKQGGIEWMVYCLVEDFIKKGYQVLLFAPNGTKTSAELIPVGPKPIGKYKILPEYEKARKLRLELSALSNIFAEVLKRKEEIGIIFNHTVSGGMFSPLEKILNVPVLHILHLPLFKELANVFEKYNAKLISISNNQRKLFPNLNYQSTIYNGINLEKFPFSKKSEDYFIFSGKITQAKNPLGAIEAVKAVKKKLIIVGRINDEEYFKTKIKPSLDKNIIYLGEVSFSKMKNLYKNAKAFLFPIQWQEPFGLVMIEAMACGTPVIAFNRGAVPEVVVDGKTGFIVKDKKEMISAIKKIDKIKREDCRKYVEEKFSSEKMIDGYKKVYYKMLKK
jgi:glycosyltransferase involved in cell wall biosynthesis